MAGGEKGIDLGLGYVRREALAAGPKIDLNGIEATVVDLPFNDLPFKNMPFEI